MKKRVSTPSAFSDLAGKAFSQLPQNLQTIVILKLIDHSIIEPSCLTILRFLCPNPKQYFTQELLNTRPSNFTIKQNILNIFKKHFYNITKAHEDNFINILKYLFSDNQLNIKDFLLDEFVSFNKILISLLTNRNNKLVEYLLLHTANDTYTFQDKLTDVFHDTYSLYDIFADQFPRKLCKHFLQLKIQRKNPEQVVKLAIRQSYEKHREDYLNLFWVYSRPLAA
ncbi:MAG: hypothetical protein LN588_02060 [Rickettsia endosymbiont of Bryobia graminum]|nr:hypothetical protein [Rickettsia endosymbiont of Bryobia graminum]